MTSLHKQVVENNNNNNDSGTTKLKPSLSTRAAARRSVCLSSTSYTLGEHHDNGADTTSTPITISPLKSSTTTISSPTTPSSTTIKSILVSKKGSKEEPISQLKTNSNHGSGSSSNSNISNLYTASTFSSSTKKVTTTDRPSINPGFRKPKDAFLSGNGSSSGKLSTTISSSTNLKLPIQISHYNADSTTTTTTTTESNSSQIKHTAASLSKMKQLPTDSPRSTLPSSSSTMKSRSVSISNGSLFSPPNTSSTSSNIKTPTKSISSGGGSSSENLDQNTPPQTPPSSSTPPLSTPPTSKSSSTSTTPSKSSVDDVFARLANVTKPVIKSRSLSVSANLARPDQQPPSPSPSQSSSSSSSFSSKFTKILRSSSKTPTPTSTTTTTTTTTNVSSSASKVSSSISRKDTKSLSSFTKATTSSSASKATQSSSSNNSITESNSVSSNNLTNLLTQSISPTPSSSSSTLSSTITLPPTISSITTTTTITTTMTPSSVLKNHINELTNFEQSEILSFPNIYFIGKSVSKKIKSNSILPNNGYDNEIGEYRVVEGDHIAYRFEVISILGQGSFCQVVKANDIKSNEIVALKILRNQKRFHNQALTEIKILEYLKTNDPNSTASIVHLNNHFYFRNHLILTFELLSMNLYDFLKVNHFQGYNLNLVRRFGAQILTSLRFLSKRNIIHADLKPENILLKSPTKSGIKLIDFGSSCFENEQIFTYIQSRFYRSPEVILGVKYDKSIDIWSLGCILVEIFTGVPLFAGADEPEQLSCIMEVLGVPPKSIIDGSTRKDIFFEDDYTPKPVKNSTTGELYTIGTRSFKDLIKSGDDDFDDFILSCLQWEPSNRITAEQGLKHDWIIKVVNSLTTPASGSTPSTPS